MSNQDQFDTMMEEQVLAEDEQVEQENIQPVEALDTEEVYLRTNPTVVVKNNDAVVFEHSLENFPVLIGRKNHNHIVLDEKNVSREHAQIVLKDDQYFVRDLGSTGGTRVNNEPVEEKDIHTGDTVEIGSFKLLFNSGIPEDERTIFDADDQTMLEDGTEMDEDRTMFADEPFSKLKVIQSSSVEGEIALLEHETIIGRDENADITLDEKRVSRQHCKIWLDGTTYKLKDLGSVNGTFVNNKRVAETELKNKDRIQIGSTQFDFIIETFVAPDKKRRFHPAIVVTVSVLALAAMIAAGFKILPAFLPTKPQKVILQKLWEQPTYMAVTTSPSLGDVNGDKQMDVVTADMGGIVYAMDTRQGGSIWNEPLITKGGALTSSPLLADINQKDGEFDVVMATTTQGVWTINGSDRKLIWNGKLNSPASGTPAATDINDDGIADVFVGSQKGMLTCFDGRQGGVVWQIDLEAPLETSPRLADLNKDGYADVVIGAKDSRIHALDGRNGKAIWVYVGAHTPSTVAIADLNHDKRPDVAVMTSHQVLAIEGEKGAELWSWNIPTTSLPTQTDPFRPLALAVADLNKDKVPDVIVATSGGHVYAVDGTSGGQAYIWDYGISPARKTAPAIYDMNHDQVADVIIGDTDRYVTVLDGTNGHLLNQIQLDGSIEGMPVIADLNGNKTADIVVGTKNKSIVAIESESSSKRNQIIWNSY